MMETQSLNMNKSLLMMTLVSKVCNILFECFFVIIFRTDVYKYSFFPRTICDWNKLPLTIRSSPSPEAFKRTLDSWSDC